MDKRYFKKLLLKFLNGTATKEEQQFLESYYNFFESEKNALYTLSNYEKRDLGKNMTKHIWETISKNESKAPKIRSIHKTFIRITAAAVFIGIVGTLFFFYHTSNHHNTNFATEQVKDKSKRNSNLEISHPQKENKVIFLPDGSTVFLSPGSRLNYASTFDGKKKREVFLQGQGFFDIKHNASRPFIVHSGQVATTVLGTAFNIKAQPHEKYITVTVKRGKVSVSDRYKTLGVITPREQITYNTDKQTSTLTKVANDSYLDWKNGDLFINNLTLAQAAKLLEEQYKIRIIIKDSSIRELRFTATFPKNETLELALRSISEFNGLSYSINKDKSIVTVLSQ